MKKKQQQQQIMVIGLVYPPVDVVGWSAMCDCGISWSSEGLGEERVTTYRYASRIALFFSAVRYMAKPLL